MSIITKENFYTAYFIDDARENIEVLLKATNDDSNGRETHFILNTGSSGNQDSRLRAYFYQDKVYTSSAEYNFNQGTTLY